MSAGLVRPFSYDEWLELPFLFTHQVRFIQPILYEVAAYKNKLAAEESQPSTPAALPAAKTFAGS